MNPQERAILESNLKWYFCEADGQLGVRSTFPGMQARANVTALCKPAQEGQIHLHEDRSSNTEFDGLPATMAAAARRASEIHQRLAAVGVRHARTLELMYACAFPFQNVSADLACETNAAVVGFKAAQSAVLKAMAEKMSRSKFKPATRGGPGFVSVLRDDSSAHAGEWYGAEIGARSEKPKGHYAHPRSLGMTNRGWLAWLANEADRGNEHAKELVGRIAIEAHKRLESAMAAYDGARRCAA